MLTIMENNHTEYVEDPFGEVNEEYLRYDGRQTAFQVLLYTEMVTSILKFILCLCVIAVDILLIYVITKFKRLHSTVNSYIKHYAIFNISYFVSAFLTRFVYHSLLSCLDIQIELTSMFFSFLFAFALALDWLIMTFKPEYGLKIKHCYKYLTLSIYILGFPKFLIQSTLCFTDFYDIEIPLLVVISYVPILLFVLVLDFLNYRYKTSIQSGKIVYSLTVANIIVLCWLPMFIYHFWYQVQEEERITRFIFWYTEFIPEWISCSISIIILIALVKMDKNFRMAFAKIFKRSVRSYSNDEENLDESDEEGDTQPDTNVSYNNSITCVKI